MMSKEQIEDEISKVKGLIKLVKEKREKDIKESYFGNVVGDVGFRTYKYIIENKFLDFLKNQEIDKTLMKKLKSINFRKSKSNMMSIIINYSRNEWKEFLEILSILKEYYPKYKLHNAKKDLCYYTDCYKKLATSRFCERCSSENPLEALFCNRCGEKLDGEKKEHWSNIVCGTCIDFYVNAFDIGCCKSGYSVWSGGCNNKKEI